MHYVLGVDNEQTQCILENSKLENNEFVVLVFMQFK